MERKQIVKLLAGISKVARAATDHTVVLNVDDINAIDQAMLALSAEPLEAPSTQSEVHLRDTIRDLISTIQLRDSMSVGSTSEMVNAAVTISLNSFIQNNNPDLCKKAQAYLAGMFVTGTFDPPATK